MSRPRIGITLRVVNSDHYPEKRDAISQDWFKILEKLNYIPICIPNILTDLKQFLIDMNLDGFILSGGDNIGDHPERDLTEQQIIDYAINSTIPILGVCRGMQVINKYFGGSIKTNKNLEHVGKPHNVEIVNNVFFNLFTNTSIMVNSFHNNLIPDDMLGKELDIFAISKKDNTVEGFIHTKFPIIGVMWHPERDPDKKNLSLLKNLFQTKKLSE